MHGQRTRAEQLSLWPDATFAGGQTRHLRSPAQARADARQIYLNSPQWRCRRSEAIGRARFRCENCGRERRLQVHHLSYDHERDEWAQDLKALCVSCHLRVHEAEQEARYQGSNRGC
jgi:5-methylcytosine-specific restriction endonuclease McrA